MAFKTNRGLFEPQVMFFGLTNSPATFQSMMNSIFREEISEGNVVIYLDDILIFSSDLEAHRTLVRRILEKLRKHQLFLKPEKCDFEQPLVEYLGVVVGGGQLRMDRKKVDAVQDWPSPNLTRD